jgi:hypothetical protein
MPEQLTKHPEVTIHVLRSAGAKCGEGSVQEILTKWAPGRIEDDASDLQRFDGGHNAVDCNRAPLKGLAPLVSSELRRSSPCARRALGSLPPILSFRFRPQRSGQAQSSALMTMTPAPKASAGVVRPSDRAR